MTTGQGARSVPGRFLRDSRGATAMIFAIALPVLAGMAALAIDVGVWTVQKRQAQGAADQAAYSAAVANKAGASGVTDGRAIAAGMGFVHGQNGVSVEINSPPTAGSFAGDSGYWEAIVRQPQASGLAALFLANAPMATARAVAGGASGGNACIIALSPTGNAMEFDNGISVSNNNCNIYSNSGLKCANNCDIAASMYTVGTVTWGNKKPSGAMYMNQPALADPYSDVTVSPPACTVTTKVTSGGSYSPGRYCEGFDLGNNTTVNLAPGIYYIDKRFLFGNGFTLNATGGVTLIFREGAAFIDANQPELNITAPTSGPYQGIAIMGLDSSPATQWFKNGADFNVQGAIYFPHQTLEFKNNGTFSDQKCTQIVVYRLIGKNNFGMKEHCPGSGIRNVGGSTVQLLE